MAWAKLRREQGKNPDDELEMYEDLRSMGSAEACWKTFEFPMYSRYPAVERLDIHLDGDQNCNFEDGTERQVVQAGPPQTSLTAWFDTIKRNSESRKACDAERGMRPWSAKYPDFVERYRYIRKSKSWQLRKNGCRNGSVIGRVRNVHPSEGPLFYMRMLLHHVPASELSLADSSASPEDTARDAYSFEALKYCDGIKRDTFKDACAARGLLQDDGEWRSALEDASGVCMPGGIRALFGYILNYNEPADPAKLFDNFWRKMGEDYERQITAHTGIAATDAVVCASVLLDIEQRIKSSGKQLTDFNLSLSDEDRELADHAEAAASQSREPKEIRDELIPQPDRAQLAESAKVHFATLKPSQRAAYLAVLQAVKDPKGRRIFFDAPGGTGKTYTFNTILSALRAEGHIVLAVASSGIAAILLELARTFHSRFKCERLHPAADQTLNISAQSDLAKLLRRCSAIFWDEAAMGNKYHLEALDKTLRDFMNSNVPFGGKTIVLGGDFRQTLPIVKFASRAQIIRVALTNSHLWPEFQQFQFEENMRIERAREQLQRFGDGSDGDHAESLEKLQRFAEWLLRLGDGAEPTNELSHVALPDECCLPEGCDIDALVAWVYPSLSTNCTSTEWLSGRAILAPYNDDVTTINDKVSVAFPGREWVCKSADKTTDPEDDAKAPAEVLNAIAANGLPAHEIRLKPNMPIMLLRNLDPVKGLCNGTRLLVRQIINGRILEAEIATGSHRGTVVYIPRIKLSPDEGIYPWPWSRLQFPVRVAFAMTINKAQGQTLTRVGVYLERPCFSHGQLYVAASRVGLPTSIMFAVDRNEAGEFRTANVVFQEALTR